MRADMDEYISKFDVYQGRNTIPKDYNFPACYGLEELVVAHFTSDLLQKKSSCLFWQLFFLSYFDGIFENQKYFCLCYY